MNDGSSHGAEPAGYRLDVPRGRGLEAQVEQADLQAVQQARAVFLVKQQVAEVRQRHPADARPRAPAALREGPCDLRHTAVWFRQRSGYVSTMRIDSV
jgi:hypothetical protein